MNDNVATPPPVSGGAPQDDRNIAMLTHLSGILLGFIVPLIIWLVNKDNAGKGWLVAQAKEALNFQILVAIVYVICSVLMVVLIGFLLFPLAWVANLVFCILAGLAASKGENYRYPISLRLIQ